MENGMENELEDGKGNHGKWIGKWKMELKMDWKIENGM